MTDNTPDKEEPIIPVSFKCKRCGGIMTLGVKGGRKALNSPPPCCLYCGFEKIEDTNKHLPLKEQLNV